MVMPLHARQHLPMNSEVQQEQKIANVESRQTLINVRTTNYNSNDRPTFLFPIKANDQAINSLLDIQFETIPGMQEWYKKMEHQKAIAGSPKMTAWGRRVKR